MVAFHWLPLGSPVVTVGNTMLVLLEYLGNNPWASGDETYCRLPPEYPGNIPGETYEMLMEWTYNWSRVPVVTSVRII
jgi:hypothetical protein